MSKADRQGHRELATNSAHWAKVARREGRTADAQALQQQATEQTQAAAQGCGRPGC